jgi:hypothetical protein
LVVDHRPAPEPLYWVLLTAAQEVQTGVTRLTVLGPGCGVIGPNEVDPLAGDELPGPRGGAAKARSGWLLPPPPPHAAIAASKVNARILFPIPPSFCVFVVFVIRLP